jgi:hypothetical protein
VKNNILYRFFSNEYILIEKKSYYEKLGMQKKKKQKQKKKLSKDSPKTMG